MINDLIYDVGMNNGDDTAYYLSLGYKVVAIDASPDLVKQAFPLFIKQIKEKRLQILNVGIAAEEGEMDFYLNKYEPAWNSFNVEIGGRGGAGFDTIKVKTKSLDQIINENGVPYYLKIDIEGYDFICLVSLGNCKERPKYLSVELTDINLIIKLSELGYNQFKIIDQQSLLPLEIPPTKEYTSYIALNNFRLSMNIFIRIVRKLFGSFIIELFEKKFKYLFKYDHPHGSSGPFGEMLPGKWLGYNEVLQVYNRYKEKLENSKKDISYSFWIDIHATKNMIENDGPLVSVLMTAFNRQKYISDAIESVLASSYTNFELIIVDDCSIDNTIKIARLYERKDARVKLYLNSKNLGDYLNRNKAASYAKGIYLKYLDSDDAIYPWGLAAMIYCMEKFPKAGFGLMSQNISNTDALPIALEPRATYRKFFFKGQLIGMGPSAAIIRKDAFESAGGFSGKQFIGDTELWYKLGSVTPLVCMPGDLIWWREHDDQQIRKEQKNAAIIALRYKLTRSFLLSKDCPLQENEKEMALKNTMNLYCRRILKFYTKGRFRDAFRLKRNAKISLLDLVKSLQRNRYPNISI